MPKRFRLKIDCLAAAFSIACLAHAQAFDAASVKPSSGGRPEPNGGPGTKDPGRIHYPNLSLQSFLQIAYRLQPFQIVGPGWLDTERYDIDAVLPPDTTPDQFHAMLQNLLATRFRIESHRETRQLSGYALVLARNGPKFTESRSEFGPPKDTSDSARPQLGKDGYFVPPKRPGLFFQLVGTNAARESFQESAIAELANSLQSQLQRPVVDATGLAGKYDFVLTFSTEGLDLGKGRMLVGPNSLENPPDLFHALPSQLGLRLEPRKAPAEMLVIDHAEKTPTGN